MGEYGDHVRPMELCWYNEQVCNVVFIDLASLGAENEAAIVRTAPIWILRYQRIVWQTDQLTNLQREFFEMEALHETPHS